MQTLTLEKKHIIKDVSLILMASFLICLSGNVYIPLPFTPVPITMQNTAILLLSALMGSKRGFLAVLAFLVQGMFGLPVFSEGLGGIFYLIGPTGGYFAGYLVAGFLVGKIAERNKTLQNAFYALVVGNLVVYAFGGAYLATFFGIQSAFLMGIVPFLIGDVLKTIFALKVLHHFGWKKG